MKRYSRRTRIIPTALFFALILSSGITLAATGNFENPFAVFSTATHEGGPPQRTQESDSESGTTTDVAIAAVRSEGMGRGAGGGDQGITWAQFGHVLYNAWFMLAATGVVIIVGKPLGSMMKRLRHYPRLRSAA